MKANELMIGDWVKFPSGYEKIQEISYQQEIGGYCAWFAASATLFPCKVEDIEPIPITPEILEKNGFKEYNGYGYASNKGYCFEGFYINYDFTTRMANIDCKFNYVHELQHALKLCGIKKTIEP